MRFGKRNARTSKTSPNAVCRPLTWRKWRGFLASTFTSCAAILVSSCPAYAGVAVLGWGVPTRNVDGSPLTDLAGFRIYSGCVASGQYERPVVSVGPNVNSYTIEDLPDFGRCWFVTSAINSAGTESAYSNVATKYFGEVALPGKATIKVSWSESQDIYSLSPTDFGPPVQAGNFNVSPNQLEIEWEIDWVSNGARWPRIISKAIGSAEQDHVFMVSLADGFLRFRLKTDGTTSTLFGFDPVPLGVSSGRATYDGSEMRLYLNGTLNGLLTKTGQITQNDWPVAVGAQPDKSNAFEGQISVTVH